MDLVVPCRRSCVCWDHCPCWLRPTVLPCFCRLPRFDCCLAFSTELPTFFFWNLRMSSSVFATVSRFTFKFLHHFCRCRSLGAGSPYLNVCDILRVRASSGYIFLRNRSPGGISFHELALLPRMGFTSQCLHEAVHEAVHF